jgi:spore coat polysaccharide biosynthesis predicted glycosyltransferase SpsG
MGVVHMVIRVLQELEGVIRSIVVVGDHDDAKENFIGTDSRISLQSNVADMAEIMSHSDIAVSAGGSTCWELAFIGVPNIIIVLAENQESVARSLDEQGVAVNLGGYSSVDQGMLRHIIAKLMHDPAARMSMSEKGRRLVDGRGAERVTAILRETMQ